MELLTVHTFIINTLLTREAGFAAHRAEVSHAAYRAVNLERRRMVSLDDRALYSLAPHFIVTLSGWFWWRGVREKKKNDTRVLRGALLVCLM